MDNTHSDLPVEWADIDSEGLVRVYDVDGFRAGVALVTVIAQAAERVGYEPSVTLTPSKVTVTIADDESGRNHQLAHAIDSSVTV